MAEQAYHVGLPDELDAWGRYQVCAGVALVQRKETLVADDGLVYRGRIMQPVGQSNL